MRLRSHCNHRHRVSSPSGSSTSSTTSSSGSSNQGALTSTQQGGPIMRLRSHCRRLVSSHGSSGSGSGRSSNHGLTSTQQNDDNGGGGTTGTVLQSIGNQTVFDTRITRAQKRRAEAAAAANNKEMDTNVEELSRKGAWKRPSAKRPNTWEVTVYNDKTKLYYTFQITTGPSGIPNGGTGAFIEFLGGGRNPRAFDSSITTVEMDGVCINLGKYGPFSKHEIITDDKLQTKSFVYENEPDVYSMEYTEPSSNASDGETLGAIDITNDGTGEPSERAKRDFLMRINEVGPGMAPGSRNVYILEDPNDDNAVYFFFKAALRLRHRVELLTHYGDSYEPMRERKGYGLCNLRDGVLASDNHLPTRLQRGVQQRHDLLEMIEDYSAAKLSQWLAYVKYLKGEIQKQATPLSPRQHVALQRVQWILQKAAVADMGRSGCRFNKRRKTNHNDGHAVPRDQETIAALAYDRCEEEQFENST